jgi:hypothetical protein
MNKFKHILKQIAYWTLPSGVNNLISDWRANLWQSQQLSSEEKNIVANNQKLRDRHQGERCFILATGPSIKTQDLTLLKGETCIAVSNFFVHPDYQIIQPKYYCIAPYHQPITEKAFQSWLDELSLGIGNAEIFFSIKDRQRIENKIRFEQTKVNYLNLTGDWQQLFNYGINLTKALPAPQSVPVMALQLSIYLGFKEIYLLGCDHDWILHINESRHFYQEEKHILTRQGYSEWSNDNYDFSNHCQDYIKLWQAYKNIKNIATKENIKIFNATSTSLLDVFPIVNYKTILQISK